MKLFKMEFPCCCQYANNHINAVKTERKNEHELSTTSLFKTKKAGTIRCPAF